MLLLGLDPHERQGERAAAPLSHTTCCLRLPYMWAFSLFVICMWTKPNAVSGCVLPESESGMRAARELQHEHCVCGVVRYGVMLSDPWLSNMRDTHSSPVLTNGGAPGFRFVGIFTENNQDLLAVIPLRAQLPHWVACPWRVPSPSASPLLLARRRSFETHAATTRCYLIRNEISNRKMKQVLC
jgi:hypothetical protein